MSCSGVDDPRSTELTPSFLRHQAGKREQGQDLEALLMTLHTPPAATMAAPKLTNLGEWTVLLLQDYLLSSTPAMERIWCMSFALTTGVPNPATHPGTHSCSLANVWIPVSTLAHSLLPVHPFRLSIPSVTESLSTLSVWFHLLSTLSATFLPNTVFILCSFSHQPPNPSLLSFLCASGYLDP